jgi:hypothetical protein
VAELFNVADIAVFGVVPLKTGGFQRSEINTMRQSLLETGFMSVIKDSKESDRSRFRLIDQHSFDVVFAKFCISYCRSRHDTRCNSKDFTGMVALRVIDCRTRTIVDAPHGCGYIALSYVWGAGTSRPIPQYANVLPALEYLPKVIADSIDVTLKIGFQYLWVDQYCIDQYDKEMRHEQICQMDLIYSNAELTIIAVAGRDASYGLPGINGTQRRYQPRLKHGNHLLLSTLSHPRFLVEHSKWATRGWTFQEGVLSKRRLFFTDEQIVFDCNTGHCAEIMSHPSTAMHPDAGICSPKNTSELENPISPFVHKNTDDPTTIMSFISEFSRRSLTFPGDRLNAMQGIFQSFSKGKWPLWHVMGVPVFKLAESEPAWHLQDLSPSCSAEHAFIAGLSWGSLSPGKRNEPFPSWTWAGWTSKLNDKSLSCGGYWCQRKEIHSFKLSPKIWLEGSNKSLDRFPKDFTDVGLFLQEHALNVQFLHIESITISCSLDIDSGFSELEPGVERKYFASDYELNIKILGSIPGLEVVFVPFRPDESYTTNSSNTEVTEPPQCKALIGVLLSTCHGGFCGFEGKILILEEKVGYFQRVGVAFLEQAFIPVPSDKPGKAGEWLGIAQTLKFLDKFKEVRRIRIG